MSAILSSFLVAPCIELWSVYHVRTPRPQPGGSRTDSTMDGGFRTLAVQTLRSQRQRVLQTLRLPEGSEKSTKFKHELAGQFVFASYRISGHFVIFVSTQEISPCRCKHCQSGLTGAHLCTKNIANSSIFVQIFVIPLL